MAFMYTTSHTKSELVRCGMLDEAHASPPVMANKKNRQVESEFQNTELEEEQQEKKAVKIDQDPSVTSAPMPGEEEQEAAFELEALDAYVAYLHKYNEDDGEFYISMIDPAARYWWRAHGDLVTHHLVEWSARNGYLCIPKLVLTAVVGYSFKPLE